ncbi:hypothetical protein MNB_SM-3-1144 [hydrothermal vent metagenome]|uniref:Ferric siderophore transport system, periplasmic binding protein TonB n=1 Tax=hydrothermal vent metagenome TaxID=652676 RepID=A0A1W1D541_9ZZZZ
MKKILLASIISLSLYLFVIFLFFVFLSKENITKKKIQHTPIKIVLKDIKINKKLPPKIPFQKAQKKQIAKIHHNHKKLKQSQPKKYHINQKPKHHSITPKKKIQQKKIIQKKHQVQKLIIQKNIPIKQHTIKKTPQQPQKKPSLFDTLSKDHYQSQQTTQKPIPKDIQALYGNQFQKLSQTQQKYIIDNQEIMRRITQEILNRVAMINLPTNFHINAQNVVEFYLYPNGDISDFKFLQKSGSVLLDETTKETIFYAYKKYPRPKEKTLIRYNVQYFLKF